MPHGSYGPGYTRRMLGIETASKISIFIERSKVKSCQAFLPGGVQIEDLTQAS